MESRWRVHQEGGREVNGKVVGRAVLSVWIRSAVSEMRCERISWTLRKWDVRTSEEIRGERGKGERNGESLPGSRVEGKDGFEKNEAQNADSDIKMWFVWFISPGE
jgi:hypothetical protein